MAGRPVWEAKVVTGIKADSRFCLIAAVVERAGLHPAQGTVRVVSPLQRRRWSRPTGQPRLRTSSIPGHRLREGERLSGSGWAAGSGVVAFTVDPCPRGRGCVGHCGLEGSGWWHRYSIGKDYPIGDGPAGAPSGDVPGLRQAQCLLANSPAAVVPGMCPGEGLLHASIATGLLGSAQRRAVPVRCRASLGMQVPTTAADEVTRRNDTTPPARHEGASQVDRSRTTAVTPAGTGKARGQRHPRRARAHPVGQAPSGSTGLPMTRPWTARSS